MSLTFLPKTILELGFQTKEILPFFIEFWWGDVRNLKTVLNSAKFLFKALSESCYCKERAMFTCAKEKVTFVSKNTYGIVIGRLTWGLEIFSWQPISHVRNIQWETCAKTIPTNKVSRLCFGTFPSIFFLFTAISHLQFCTMTSFIVPCRGIGILESGISVLFVESGILGFSHIWIWWPAKATSGVRWNIIIGQPQFANLFLIPCLDS